jgi:hypothetical protein
LAIGAKAAGPLEGRKGGKGRCAAGGLPFFKSPLIWQKQPLSEDPLAFGHRGKGRGSAGGKEGGNKKLDFQDFCKISKLVKKKKHLQIDGIKKISLIKSEMNTNRV